MATKSDYAKCTRSALRPGLSADGSGAHFQNRDLRPGRRADGRKGHYPTVPRKKPGSDWSLG